MFRLAFGALLWVLVTLGQPCTAKTYVYPPDAAILLEAKAGWGGGDVLYSWDASQPCDKWEGVLCDAHGRPSLIDLEGFGVSGSLPSSFGNLSALENLSLKSNELSGSIPSSIGSLPALQGLQLSYNQLSGSLPATLGNLTGLSDLQLSYNQLSGSIPSSIGNLTRLLVLRLFSNRLSGSIPSNLKLASIQSVDFSSNFLSGICPTDLQVASGANCFQNCSADNPSVMRSKKECSTACGSDQTTGPCSGKGACFVSGTRNPSTCVCKPGFVSPASNLGTCVPDPSLPSPPPFLPIPPHLGADLGQTHPSFLTKVNYGLLFACGILHLFFAGM